MQLQRDEATDGTQSQRGSNARGKGETQRPGF